jgi:hypothetical protein
MLEECRSTFLRPQALLALVVGLAACGQERATEPLAAFSRATGDTGGVLRAVATAIIPVQAQEDSARAASDHAARCRPRFGTCWDFGNAPWYISTSDNAVLVLAQLLGRPIEQTSPGLARPPCPWASGSTRGGYRAAVGLRFAHPDTAEVVLSRKCDYLSGRGPRAFGAHEAFEVIRSNGVWVARITEVGMT